jgi:uncharacterized repeat protein (TIGR04076 family)
MDRRAGGKTSPDDRFELYDLRVELVAPPGAKLYCGGKPGDFFEMRGELLHFNPDMPFSLYSLAAILPLLPAKQRPTHENDWMATDAEVACPDPNCPSRLRITRLGKRRFSHAEVTAVPLPPKPRPAKARPGKPSSRKSEP